MTVTEIEKKTFKEQLSAALYIFEQMGMSTNFQSRQNIFSISSQ